MVFIPSAESKRNEWLTRCENPVNESKKNSERAIVRNFFVGVRWAKVLDKRGIL